MGEKIRLDKLLSNMGKGSRSEMKDALRFGGVKVNGVTVRTGKEKVDPDKDEILYKGIPVVYIKHVYLLLNKPDGYISATEDKFHKTVLELIGSEYDHYDLFPVGRLDIDTEGLLIITNDGELTHNLLAPKKHVPKTYRAFINGPLNASAVTQFEEGITLDDGYKCKPAELEILSTSMDESEVKLTIHEGKFHQVKRMFESIDLKVTYLQRIKMNELSLPDDLAVGEFRPLTEDEFKALTKGIDL